MKKPSLFLLITATLLFLSLFPLHEIRAERHTIDPGEDNMKMIDAHGECLIYEKN